MILAALVTGFVWRSAWPDLIAGAAIFSLNLNASRAVWNAAHREYRDTLPQP
jgi:Co/Zn/Cd efflux system component